MITMKVSDYNMAEDIAYEIILGGDRFDWEDVQTWVKEKRLSMDDVKAEVDMVIRRDYSEDMWNEEFLEEAYDYWFLPF